MVERQAAPAAETSFANGGQISVSHVEPWANPGAPWKILRWLGREDALHSPRGNADPSEQVHRQVEVTVDRRHVVLLARAAHEHGTNPKFTVDEMIERYTGCHFLQPRVEASLCGSG